MLKLIAVTIIITFVICIIGGEHIEKREGNKFNAGFKAIVVGKYEWRGYGILLDTTSLKIFNIVINVSEELYNKIRINDTLEKVSSSKNWILNSKEIIEIDNYFDCDPGPPKEIKIITE